MLFSSRLAWLWLVTMATWMWSLHFPSVHFLMWTGKTMRATLLLLLQHKQVNTHPLWLHVLVIDKLMFCWTTLKMCRKTCSICDGAQGWLKHLETCLWVFSLWPTGHILISSYLLNYFPGLDIERRNCHGFTALMKAAVQGRAECVRAIMLAGNTHHAALYYTPCIQEYSFDKQDECSLGSFLTTILFPRRECSGPRQWPRYDAQGVGSVHWSIRNGQLDASPHLQALCWAVLWFLFYGVAHAGGNGTSSCCDSLWFLHTVTCHPCTGAGVPGPGAQVLLETSQPLHLLSLQILYEQQSQSCGRWCSWPHGACHHQYLQSPYCHSMPHGLSQQPSLHWEASSCCAGDPEETADSWAQANGPRETQQLQEIFPEFTDPPYSQDPRPEGKSPASSAAQRCRGIHRGHETSQFTTAEHAAAEQRASRPGGA